MSDKTGVKDNALLVDENGKIVEAGSVLARQLGYGASDLQDQPLKLVLGRLVPEDVGVPSLKKALEGPGPKPLLDLTGGEISMTCTVESVLSPDGTSVLAMIQAAPYVSAPAPTSRAPAPDLTVVMTPPKKTVEAVPSPPPAPPAAEKPTEDRPVPPASPVVSAPGVKKTSASPAPSVSETGPKMDPPVPNPLGRGRGALLSSAFLVNVSHEFRTPLNGLMGTSSLLADSPLSPQQKEWVDLMRLSAQNLFEVLNNVLDYARLQAGDLTLRLDGFSLNQFLKDLGAPMAGRAEAKGLSFTLHAPAEDIVLRGDPERVKQVLNHLAANGFKFTEKGGVTLKGEVLSIQGQEVRVLFTVSDTGLGIPPEQRERIFEAYSQGDNSTTRAQGGLGLGLALSEKLVAYMGGSLKMESTLGQGSTFLVEIPFEKGTEVVPETAKPGPELPKNIETVTRHHYRILLVDDNAINQKVAQLQLEKLGYRADVANNGREAVEMFGKKPYDLVLMDCQMPELDGYGATEEIRKSEDKKRHVPIVAVTANASDEDRERCRASGMDEYLTKPLAIETLSSLMARWDRSIDTETLNGLKELGEDSFPQLRDDFLNQTRDQIALLRQSIDKKEWKPAKSAAHKVKGTSGTFGAVRLQKLGRWAEEAALAERGAELGLLCESLEEELARVQVHLTAPAK